MIADPEIMQIYRDLFDRENLSLDEIMHRSQMRRHEAIKTEFPGDKISFDSEAIAELLFAIISDFRLDPSDESFLAAMAFALTGQDKKWKLELRSTVAGGSKSQHQLELQYWLDENVAAYLQSKLDEGVKLESAVARVQELRGTRVRTY